MAPPSPSPPAASSDLAQSLYGALPPDLTFFPTAHAVLGGGQIHACFTIPPLIGAPSPWLRPHGPSLRGPRCQVPGPPVALDVSSCCPRQEACTGGYGVPDRGVAEWSGDVAKSSTAQSQAGQTILPRGPGAPPANLHPLFSSPPLQPQVTPPFPSLASTATPAPEACTPTAAPRSTRVSSPVSGPT